MGVLWSIHQTNKELVGQLKQVTEWKVGLSEGFADLNVDLKKLINKPDPMIESDTLHDSSSNVSLVDGQGKTIAHLKNQNATGEFQSVSDTGYHFSVSLQGKLGWPLRSRYFETRNCQGNTYVNEANASLYRDSNDLLWFVDKFDTSISVVINSKLTKDKQCMIMENVLLDLRQLKPNDPKETGINEHRSRLIHRG